MDDLLKISKDNPFRIPDGYFDEFPEKMRKRLESGNYRTYRWNLFPALKPYFVLGIATVVFALITYTAVKFLTVKDIKILTTEEIAEMFQQDPYDIDGYMVEELWAEIADSVIVTTEIGDTTGNTTNEIIEYLLDNEIDDYLLLAEL
ncbi:MAG: hypothetical protein KJ607_05170 [Bacteroidetes bacterium]|nr:hypothetical protein [Bacteroidota bacterium]